MPRPSSSSSRRWPCERANLGPDHPHTLQSINNLAASYKALGRHADALQLDEQALALRTARLGRDHADTLQSMNNLAASYFAVGRRDEAIKLHEEAVALRTAKFGRDHPDTLGSMSNLAVAYTAADRPADALKLHEEAVALRTAKFGRDHPDTLDSMWGVAASLMNLDRGAEAVPVIDECVRRAAGHAVGPDLIPGVMDLRLRHFETAGDAAGCRATAEMWEVLHRTDAASLYNAACFRAVTAKVLRTADHSSADAEADRAMAWLKQAVAASYKDVAKLKSDKDLDALRGRTDFRQLVAGLRKNEG